MQPHLIRRTSFAAKCRIGGALALLLVVLSVGILALLAVGQGPSGSGDQAVAAYCFEQVGFGREPVPVAKTADLSEVLAEVRWGYNPAIGCYLVIDDHSQSVLRASTADLSLDLPTAADQATAEYCYATAARFGRMPVDIAKTADHSRVLAQVKWGHNDVIGCYLVLNDNALAALQAAAQAGPTAQPGSKPSEAEIAAAEAEAADLVNRLRQGLGLDPLIHHSSIRAVAHRWSQTMAAEDNFEHNPNYARQYPAGWSLVGENVSRLSRFSSLISAVQKTFDGLANSSGHYRNMVNPQFTHLGVGIAVDENGGFWLTQNFARYTSAIVEPTAPSEEAEPSPIRAVYAIPSGVAPVATREQAIANTVAEVQRWFRTQTGGEHPLFARNGSSISVETVRLTLTESELPDRNSGFIANIRNQLGADPNTPLLIVSEGKFARDSACGWQPQQAVVIPLGNCGIALQVDSEWPKGATYIVAHELAHLLGAVKPCAPNYEGTAHVDDDNRDLLYHGPGSRDWANLTLDVGNDDYYRHGRDDCYDIADNPLLATEPSATSASTPAPTPTPSPVQNPTVKLSKGRSAQGVSSDCTGANCHYMRVELVGFDPGTYTVYCAHYGVTSLSYPPGWWKKYSTSNTVSEQCVWGFTDSVYVIVENPTTGALVQSNDARWT